MGGEAPTEPLMFLMPNTAVVGPGDPVVLPPQTHRGRTTRASSRSSSAGIKDVEPARGLRVVFGYTCANDVTARDLQRSDGQWSRAKGFDTFCPLGPWIETDLDPADSRLVTRRDGEVSRTAPPPTWSTTSPRSSSTRPRRSRCCPATSS